MLRYFPLAHDRFEHQFGIRALPDDDSIIESTPEHTSEIKIKRQLLQEDPDNYFQAAPGSEPAQREAAVLIAQSAAIPAPAPDSSSPLLDVARCVQEDLVVLSGDSASGHPVIAGIVCFPSGWSIGNKIGQSILRVHQSVPEYEAAMGASTDQLLKRLKAGRPVWRMNWGVRSSSRLDQSPKHLETLIGELETLSAQNVGQRCHFRVERQTLSRLPTTGAILFTIHTHQCPLEALTAEQMQRLHGVLQTCPQATLDYKGIAPIKQLVSSYLLTVSESKLPK